MESDNFKKLNVEFTNDDQVLRITLATPPGNVLDAQMMTEIIGCLETSKGQPSIKMIVFEGQGKHFCFGASVEEHQKEQASSMIRNFHLLFKIR